MGLFDFLKGKRAPSPDPMELAMKGDLEAAETMRGCLTTGQASELVELYPSLGKWTQKDVVIHMLQDVYSAHMESLFRDALDSPTVETKAVCLCSLYPNEIRFEDLLHDGFVSSSLVEEARRRVSTE